MRFAITLLIATTFLIPAAAEARHPRRYDKPTYLTKDHPYDHNPYTAAITPDPYQCQESIVRTAIKKQLNANSSVAKRPNCITTTLDKTPQ